MKPVLDRDLDPGVRRLRGQHFTAARVADLVNAFCLRSADDLVLDPCCGPGDFLLRALARLRYLGGGGARLRGVELDARLAAAARAELSAAGGTEGSAIVTADFLEPAMSARALPGPGMLDAVVGNPPYVRQELLDADRKRRLARQAPVPVSGRCDLHVHFWPRALMLLKPSGRLGFVTSASWLDSGYGEALRRWIAESHRVVALIESRVESWFDDARVRTAIVILENSPPREAPPARLALLDSRLDEIAPDDLGEPQRLARFEALARAIERGDNPHGDLREASPGMLGRQCWGALLRQPGLWPELLARAPGRFVPLSDLATVRWGIKTGDDRLFFVGGAGRDDGEETVEPRFLAPAVFNLMELDRVVVTRDQPRRRLLLIDLTEQSIEGTAAQRRLRLARRRGSHRRPTCAARERSGASPRRWFELRPGPPGEILWSIMHQYRHLAPLNPDGIAANDNLLLIRALPGVDVRLLAALLNSHLQALIKLAHGRQRNEGMLKTQAADVKRMLLPDPRRFGRVASRRILLAFDQLAGRRIGDVVSECARPDRRRLDVAVVRALGFGADESERLVTRLYEALLAGHRGERRWERDAVTRRARSRRLTRLTTGGRGSATAPAAPDPDCRR